MKSTTTVAQYLRSQMGLAAQVNLAFLRSLSEEFQTFQQAMGARI
jgi:hypothetical protein